jgi:hypothetical protein
MASSYTRSDETDSYTILNSYSGITNTDLEVAIAQSLVEAQTINSGTYVSPANSTSWSSLDLSANYVNTSAISNYPAGSVTEFSAISTVLHSPDVSQNTYTTNISSVSCANNTYDFATLDTSAPFYDSNYVITQSLVLELSDNQGENTVEGLFDQSNANAKIQYGMQSRWNTTTGPYTDLETVGGDPTAITQLVNFNTNNAFAQQGTGSTPSEYVSYYATVDASDGSIDFTLVDASYQPVPNNLLVAPRDLSGVTLNTNEDVGIFRMQHPDNIVNTEVALDNGSYNTIQSNDLNNMPLFNVGGGISAASSKNSLPVPGTMTFPQFQTLLNQLVLDTVADQWTFTIDVSGGNGGYSLPEDSSGIPISNLDDSNLLDNPYYMENYVSQTHTINFNNSTVFVDASTNASSFDAASIDVDLTDGETLVYGQAGVNGEIILNTNTPSTRYTALNNVDVSSTTIPYVYYPTDSNPDASLNSAEMLTQNFQVMWQKVAQQSSTESADNYLLDSNNAIMTLYAGGIVDNCYNTVEFDFSFNNTLFNTQDVNLWRLNVLNNIILNSQSFYNDASYTALETGIATSGAIVGLTEALNFNSFRILLTSKVKADLGLQTAVNSVGGWALNYSDVSDNHLNTNNTNAYASETNLPIYISSTNITDLSFSYVYNTIQVANRPGGLSDYVNVSYTTDSSLVEFTIPQSEITRVYTSSDVSYSVVPDASYNFGGNNYNGNIYNKQAWELVHVTANSVYNATFPAKYGPYSNLNLTLSNISQTDIYYAIRNKLLGHLAPQSALSHITDASIPDLHNVYENIAPATGNLLSISGTIYANDLKPFTSVVQGENTDSTWTTISDPFDTDVYYGVNNSATLTLGTGVLNCSIEYTPFSNSTQESTIVVLTQENYYIPFIYLPENISYSLYSFNSTPALLEDPSYTNIASSSFVNNVGYLTVENNYSVVTGWQTTNYNLTVTQDASNSTFVVTDTNDDTVFTIIAKNNTVFLGDYVVSYIPNDVYRVERVLGSNYEENFYSEDYTTSGTINLNAYVPGVLIQSPLDMETTVSARPSNGSYQYFRVIGDFMTINQVVPTVAPPTSANELGIDNSGSLAFQYVSGDNYSAIFTFPKYRGYQSVIGDQYFTIVRDSTVVTFDVSANGLLSVLQDTLTTNMYYLENFVVDDLRNTSNTLIADLNISGFFPYSIPPTGSVLSFVVTVTGDSVDVTISNPNYRGGATNIPVPNDATPVVDPTTYTDSMTLKDFGQNDMYTFSGNWYTNNNLMSIRPSRVKLQNTAYNYTSLNYRIQFIVPDVEIYKATYNGFNWLGNPALHDAQDPNIPVDANDWTLFATRTASQMYTGIDIGRKTIYQNPALQINDYVVYIISVSPYYKFEQISTENCPVIPYDYETDYVNNITYRYMPYLNIGSGDLDNGFNPFATTQSYPDINASVTTVTTDANYLNDIEFTLTNAPSIDAAVQDPDTTRYGLIFPGTNLSINLYVGLYNSTNPGAHTNPIWNAPVTSIPTTANVQSNSLILRSRDASGALYFSAIQYPSDIGYPNNNSSYENIFHTSDQNIWYNIDFKIDNTAWFNDNSPITHFNADAAGIKPTLYTVVDVNDASTQVNKRRVYKYTTPASYDIDSSNAITTGFETFNFSFDSRSYADFDISTNSTFPSGPTSIWNYNNLLNNTVIPNSPITWTTDASYAGTTTYVAWTFGNSTTALNMKIDLFQVDDDEQKWAFIHLEPFQKYSNQFGLSVGSVAWDGSIVAPLTTTRVIKLAPQLTQPDLLNNTYATQQYSESTLNDIIN